MLLNKDISGLSSLKKKSIANIKVIVDKNIITNRINDTP